jgi:hypothetical protein
MCNAIASQEIKFYNSKQSDNVITQVMHNTLKVNEAESVGNGIEYYKQGGDKWQKKY